jgi:hypothetical protein
MIPPACPNPSYLHEVLTFILGLVAGVGGSFLAYKVTRSNRATNGSVVIDQSGARAGGDNVGGNKTTTTNNHTPPA